MLQILDHVPSGLLDCASSELADLLGGPTLLHVPGERPEPLHVSVLLHGNETTGWEAVRGLLQDFVNQPLPRAMSVLIGNVEAAQYGQRVLPGQQDYNRVWDGGDSAEHRMAQQVLAEMAPRSPIASIDVHNTSGPNPHYACVNCLDEEHVALARQFSRMLIYLLAPNGLHSMAFSKLCPAVTVECGVPGQSEGVAHAQAYLLQCLTEDLPIPTASVVDDVEIYCTKARVSIPSGMYFSFQDTEAECRIHPELIEHNFQQLPEGTKFGVWGHPGSRLEVEGENGQDLYDVYFENRGHDLVVRRPFFLSMLTLREDIVVQDCLCYLLEPMNQGAESLVSD